LRTLTIKPNIVSDLGQLGLKPKDLILYITSHCNLRCQHCYVGNSLLNASYFMTLDSVRGLLNGFGSLDRVTIIGGEPLLHPEFPSIQAALGEADCTERRIDSNLTSIDLLDAHHARDKRIRICVSVDGHTEALHSILRGSRSFNTTDANLRALLSLGVDVEVTHTVHARNIDHIEAFIGYCREIGIKRLNLHKVSPRGNAIGRNDLLIRPKQWVDLVQHLRSSARTPCSSPIHIRFETLYATREEAERLRAEGKYRDLASGSYYSETAGHRIVIFPDGKIYMSSEAFGSDRHIASIEDGKFVLNTSSRSELALARRGNVAITELNPRAEVDSQYPVILSVSYRESHLI
jgi:MoaA/NifB/PqqE/SkfB family radical SAM enzyme